MKIWGVRLVLFASALALMATSPAEGPSDSFALSVPGTRVQLSARVPRARFAIRPRAIGLSPGGRATTNGALAFVRGSVATVGGHSLIRVTLSSASEPNPSPRMDVVTSFGAGHGLTFEGDCLGLDPNEPCEAELELVLERVEGASPDATSEIDWSVEFSSRVSKDKGAERHLQLPWVVEIAQR